MPTALLFIPDISGYTQFVTNTEISHQEHILKELLEILMDSNDLNLELAEVEGDALFYYKINDLPDQESLLKLVRKMYLRFHSHLRYYDKYRICHCGACEGATGLNLKFVAHTGDISFLTLKGQKSKPHGREVITVHRLLKNKIPSNEYLLLTDQTGEDGITHMSNILDTEEILSGSESYGDSDVGNINYNYALLTNLRKHVTEPAELSPEYKSNSPVRITTFVEREPLDIFEIVINFDHRLKWNPGVERIDYNPNEINKSGTKHTCVVNGQDIKFKTVTADFGDGKWVYGEKFMGPFSTEMYNYTIITPYGNGSEVTIEIHQRPGNILGRLMSPIIRLKIKSLLNKVAVSLKSYAENPDN